MILPNSQDNEFIPTLWIPMLKWWKSYFLKKKITLDKDIFSLEYKHVDSLKNCEKLEGNLVSVVLAFSFPSKISTFRSPESPEKIWQINYWLSILLGSTLQIESHFHLWGLASLAWIWLCCLEIGETAPASSTDDFLTSSWMLFNINNETSFKTQKHFIFMILFT